MTDHRSQLFAAYDHAAGVVASLDPSTLGGPTPCPAMDVAALVSHLVGASGRAVALGSGESPTGEEFPEVALADAPGAIRRNGEDAAGAWADDAALARTTTMPWGETYTGAFLVDMYLAELVTHAWDLQRASGVNRAVDEELAGAALAGARAILRPEYRTPDGHIFGPEVTAPAGASTYDRLAAFMGRDPS